LVTFCPPQRRELAGTAGCGLGSGRCRRAASSPRLALAHCPCLAPCTRRVRPQLEMTPPLSHRQRQKAGVPQSRYTLNRNRFENDRRGAAERWLTKRNALFSTAFSAPTAGLSCPIRVRPNDQLQNAQVVLRGRGVQGAMRPHHWRLQILPSQVLR